MDIYTQRAYVTRLSSYLVKFKQVRHTPLLVNCRCNICGDSRKDPNKTRGFIFEDTSKYTDVMYKCHNCAAFYNFPAYLKQFFPNIYEEYLQEVIFGSDDECADTPLEDFLSNRTASKLTVTANPTPTVGPSLLKLKDFTLLSDLEEDHPVFKWIENRSITKEQSKDWGFTGKFLHIMSVFRPDVINPKKIYQDHPRVVIPFYDKDKRLIGFTGRRLVAKSSTQKYMICKIDESMPKVWGLDKIDMSRTVYIHEGPIDASFCDNSIAVNGTTLSKSDLDTHLDCARIWVLDNQPRNRQVVDRYKRLIDDGETIVIWDSSGGNGSDKDINELIVDGVKTPEEIPEWLSSMAYTGITASLELADWRRV